jgi:shikimate kinase
MGKGLRHDIILLTGPKHAGKTTLGLAAAPLWGGEFIDLDQRIEELYGRSPRALFQEGPEVFRQAEARVLEGIINAPGGESPCLAAAGGGIIDNPGAMALIAAGDRVITVYLEVSEETAWERVRRSADKTGELPPFLNTENPRETHRQLHTRRAGAYKRAARFVLSGENKAPGDIAGELLGLLLDAGVLAAEDFQNNRF